MRLTVLIALAALAPAACAVGEPVNASAEVGAEVAACSVLVRFGSYAGGIDKPAADAVATVLRAHGRAQAVEVRPWGREGERDLCVTPSSPADAATLASAARAALPSRELRGYVDILLDGRRVFTTRAAPSA